MRKVIFLSIILSLLVGCAMARHREQIRSGLLTVGLNRDAFLAEWGMPTKTRSMSSEEFTSAGWSAYGGKVYSGKAPLDVWIYEERQVTLVFNGIVLVGWKTEKTIKELRSPQK